ncbi:uncharacterized protein EHS24_001386 [Apiotrichum porosum]|uniref:Uncharacterized protein n=1 Tax=Apiotrichum porosum TaxID=105984 RepID=A0A427XKQ2_9TREE|nr:uncharacterized protein EHS24_001386 [Apiotrichum porosum]RSH79344.1 hypothetical protein EHS24_001386 [Apiotrichum porosum]
MDVASQAGHLFPVGPRHASTQDRLSFEAFCAVPYLKWHLDQIVHSGAAMIRNGLVDEGQTLTVNSTAVRDFLGRPMTREDLRGSASNPMTYQGGEDKKLFLPLTVTLVTAAESVAAAPGNLVLSGDTIGSFFDVKPMDLTATEGVSKDKHGFVSDNDESDDDITSAQ